ncbi:hypothetical protein, partial [Parvimonas sp. M20]
MDSAACGLFYQDGYPVTEIGGSFWNQLPHEPYPAFKRFMAYLEQAETHGIRQLDLLSVSEDATVEELQAYYMEFYWSARARAYDLFIVAAEAKKREHRIRKMENGHYANAGVLLERLMTRFEDPQWIEELNAKEAIDALETLIKVQRLSVG